MVWETTTQWLWREYNNKKDRSVSEFKALCKGGNESFQVIFNILKKTSDAIRFNLTELRIYLFLFLLRFLAKL